jgi:hypothetical protein
MLTISSQRLDRSRPAGRAYVSSHDNRDTEGTFNRGRIGNDKWASRQMGAAHLAGNSYMATRISLVEVPFATDTFLAYRQLGNYASALRFLLDCGISETARITYFPENCSDHLWYSAHSASCAQGRRATSRKSFLFNLTLENK